MLTADMATFSSDQRQLKLTFRVWPLLPTKPRLPYSQRRPPSNRSPMLTWLPKSSRTRTIWNFGTSAPGTVHRRRRREAAYMPMAFRRSDARRTAPQQRGARRFTNRWYAPALAHASTFTLTSSQSIRVITAPLGPRWKHFGAVPIWTTKPATTSKTLLQSSNSLRRQPQLLQHPQRVAKRIPSRREQQRSRLPDCRLLRILSSIAGRVRPGPLRASALLQCHGVHMVLRGSQV